MFKMLIVDDEYIVRTGIKETVDWSSYGINIIGEATNGQQGLVKILELRPDIVITDVRMQTMDGLELLKEIKANDVDCEVIILSGYEEFEYVREALHRGAFAYLVKPIDNSELIHTVLSARKKLEQNRNTKKYFERLSGELSAVKKQFLRDILAGLITDEKQVNEKLDFYSINLEPRNNVACYIKIDDFPSASNADNREKRNSIIADVGTIISDFVISLSDLNGVFIEMSDSEFAVILSKTNGEEIDTHSLRSIFKSVAKRFEDNTALTLSIGIGSNAKYLNDVNISFANAKKAANRKSIKGISNVIAYDDINNLGYKREIQEAIKYICDNYANDVTVEMVSKELYISASYLMHLFKDELGKTFNECLTEYRITTAKELLQLNKYKIYEISNMVGYKDVKYFSQIFKKITGMTPSEFSKKAV